MATTAQALPIIRPITDMRTKFNEVCAQATEEQEPIILTKNGTAAYVLYDSAAYEAQQKRDRVQMALREAEIEEKYRPETLSAEESDTRMREIFALWGIDYA
ncbi:MAG: type II toxin-antitoxin system Phd/YefM family antitoxin [Eggerthellaceae bacterium]|nr:type II toxin-antitoxin system Phd/YefM family antitoxin [Eggerthellaceae bacterium]